MDELGNSAVVGDTHRLTDIGIGLAGILYGSDGVNQPGLLGGSSGALRSGDFDGSGRLLDKDITVATRINLPTAPGALSLFYDVTPAVETMPKTFNDATGLSLGLWLPSVLSGFNQSGNQEARNLSPILITDAGTTRRITSYNVCYTKLLRRRRFIHRRPYPYHTRERYRFQSVGRYLRNVESGNQYALSLYGNRVDRHERRFQLG